ncbi:short-chain dehydrogenase [Streptomyces hygroscopicus subsp. hygroscopicus]|uniref:SDR family oxidoreductase n=1 Tax=Streptomyces sp. KHY 26 TaxID=3097359 RepID=UPI0024A605B6|nr:SDR family oxidoreductase [Streptomyces hygroscopicus]GLX49262.1 short-chain dehydrogenase [Streptomyces hygroscopicus subsp. hygroscopicus]
MTAPAAPALSTQSELSDERVVIIGGTSGIGWATALRSVALGASVVVASRRPEAVAVALGRLPESVEGYTLDVRDVEAVRTFFADIGEHDHLVVTAGDDLLFGALADTDLRAMQELASVRVWGAIAATQAALPYVRKSVTLSGGAGYLRPTPGFTACATILGAIEAFTRAAAAELAPVRVNAVFPGLVRSPLWDGMAEAEREQFYNATAAELPVGRVGEPTDIAKAFTHLMSNGYTTGQTLVIDGGATIGAR